MNERTRHPLDTLATSSEAIARQAEEQQTFDGRAIAEGVTLLQTHPDRLAALERVAEAARAISRCATFTRIESLRAALAALDGDA